MVRDPKGNSPRCRVVCCVHWCVCGWLCVYLLRTWEFSEEVCWCVLSVVLVV